MSKAEEQIEILQDYAAVCKEVELEESLEAGADALAFAQSLHALYQEQGVLPDDAELDLAVLENLVDAYHGELAAAAIFLSEDAFPRVSDVLRATGESLLRDDASGIPKVISKGYLRLANRVEQAKKQRQQVFQVIKEQESEKKA